MPDETFATFIDRERERLNQARQDILNQQKELERKLADLNREFSAIEAYEAAKSGRQAVPARTGRTVRAPSRGRRGSKREALLELIRRHPGGLSRREILESMGLKGDKSGEMSVSNALTALVKAGQIARRDGKYTSA